jgi:NAD(P)H-flavin reductase
VSWLARAFWFTRPFNIKSDWLSGAPATFISFPGNMTRIGVQPPSDFHWTPTQHVFLRFPSIVPLATHPFTIASAPHFDATTESKKPSPRLNGSGIPRPPLAFIVGSHSGFTRKRAVKAAQGSGKTNSVWVGGPYGWVKRPLERIYNTIILLAGGTGISACIPWLLEMTMKMKSAKAKGETIALRRVVLIWAIRHTTAFACVREELESVQDLDEVGIEVICRFHITGSTAEAPEKAGQKELSGEKGDRNVEVIMEQVGIKEMGSSLATYAKRLGDLEICVTGRPVTTEILKDFVGAGEKMMVFGCGPETFRIDLRNAVADAQKRALAGDCKEVGLDLETFGW